jgi:peptide/nickel transport system ATP-binding protein
MALLKVQDLHVHYRGRRSLVDLFARRPGASTRAVNGVSLSVARGETVGLVGESGCGKSTLGRAILRLTPASRGRVRFDGANVLEFGKEALLRFRRRAQMVFQDPYASLNPRFTVFETLAEVLRVHRVCPAAEIGQRVHELMAQVGLPLELAGRKGRSLSGGQCQRVGIARALAAGAEFLIADEPVSALDVSIQAQILKLFRQLQRERHLTLLFISHDLGVVRYLCRRVAVMYLGRIVEEGPVARIFADPKHPYTRSLIEAIPAMDPDATLRGTALAGEPPSPREQPAGCPFHPRCPRVMAECRVGVPPEARVVEGRRVACHLYPAASKVEPARALAEAALDAAVGSAG